LIFHPFPKGSTFWVLQHETIMIETPPNFQLSEDRAFANDPICAMVDDTFGNFVYNENVEDEEGMYPESSQTMSHEITGYFIHDGYKECDIF